MAPRSLLSAGLAALFAVLIAVPAGAQQLRAAAVREVAPESQTSGSAPAAMPTGDGYLVAWRAAQFTLALRTVDAFGAPVGALRTIPKTVGLWDPTELRCCRCSGVVPCW